MLLDMISAIFVSGVLQVLNPTSYGGGGREFACDISYLQTATRLKELGLRYSMTFLKVVQGY